MKYSGWAAIGLLTVGLSGTSPVKAFDTGRELGRVCAEGSSDEQIVRNLVCMAYLSGFTDAYVVSMAVMEHQAPKARKPICLPDRGVQLELVKLLVNDWLKQNPSDLAETARSVVYRVLATAYPCGEVHVKWK